jgi:hypothetical protein
MTYWLLTNHKSSGLTSAGKQYEGKRHFRVKKKKRGSTWNAQFYIQTLNKV